MKEELINNICNSREKTLRAESQELLGRMRKKVELLKEDKMDIQTEMADNTTNIKTIIDTVRSLGNMVDADKLKVKPCQNNIALQDVVQPTKKKSAVLLAKAAMK